jgi:two-component system, NarL family, nitrate/nitrite response regulator NarL
MEMVQSKQHDEQFHLLIADDDFLVADAIKFALEASGQFRVSIARSLQDLIAQDLQPNVILLDLHMPGMTGVDSVTAVVARFPQSRVVLFSGTTEPPFLRAAIDAGAKGFIPKTLPLVSLASALQLVDSGQIFVPASLLAAAMSEHKSESRGGLSPTEYRVLQGIAAGKRNKEIAWDLGTSEVTVKMHVRAIFGKLGAHNRTNAVLTGQKLGII